MDRQKILIINRGSSDNLGDQAIRISLENLLNELGHQTEFSDFTNVYNKDHYTSLIVSEDKHLLGLLSRLKSLVPNKIRWILKNYNIFEPCFNRIEFDTVIIGGGQLFNNNKVFALAMFLWVHLLKIKKNPKIVLFGIGSMRNLSISDKLLYGSALKKVDEVYVRDEYSQEVFLETFGIKTRLTYDVAFCFNRFSPFNMERDTNTKDNSNRVLLGISDYKRYSKYNDDKNHDEYYQYWKDYIMSLYNTNNTEVKLFYTTEEDLKVVKYVQDLIDIEFKIIIPVVNVKNLEDLVNEMIIADTVISQRMHALILAKIYGCRVEPIYISEKIRSFSDTYLNSNFNQGMIQKRVINDLKSAITKVNEI